MNDSSKDDDDRCLNDEQDNRVLGVIVGRIDTFEDAALRGCSIFA